ncbi:N-terminal EF-hand calcium-binding protein 1-like isoform X2 [Octopus vulgaris]|uniref:N-terminal EF-hand calcium-binding protein 1-like isoform X2 n=1 Tax=Octopus vulgaris TaxID=6645 RepID=A0AA36AID1_OCTVU|nr:N-terminal EF-hand calcium-binding protein 1-like isoform X2 [Octopus vulgaris]
MVTELAARSRVAPPNSRFIPFNKHRTAKLKMAEQNTEKGMAIFLDVFRRADRNDDGAISWTEFLGFFADGVMGKEELKALFDEIDTHNTNNIDTEELCAYFSLHLGAFKDIYAVLDDLNSNMTSVLFSTSQTYKDSSRKEQFVTRFLLHEILNQFTAVQRAMENASDALDEQAREQNEDIVPVMMDTPSKVVNAAIVPGRVARRARRQMSMPNPTSSSNVTETEFGGNVSQTTLSTQLYRLSSLVDRLENRINFDGFVDEEVDVQDDGEIILLQRNFSIKLDSKETFKNKMRNYIEALHKISGCLNSSVRSFKNSGKLTLYEVWSSEFQQARFAESSEWKTFEEQISEMLDDEIEVKTMNIPAHWWQKSF